VASSPGTLFSRYKTHRIFCGLFRQLLLVQGRRQADDNSIFVDSDMDSLNLPPFRGIMSENAETRLPKFNNFHMYKEFNDVKAKALFKVLLTDLAVVWLKSVDLDKANNWAALQQAFKTRYMTASFLKYQHAGKLFNKKQNKESVDDFCAQTQHLAKQVGADDQMLRFSVLNGLRPDIKNHVNRTQLAD